MLYMYIGGVPFEIAQSIKTNIDCQLRARIAGAKKACEAKKETHCRRLLLQQTLSLMSTAVIE